MALVQAAAHHYGMKELAEHLNKAPSTLYAELNQTDGYKIGAKDFFQTINKTGDFSALKALLGDMGWALYPLPSSKQKLPPTQSSLILPPCHSQQRVFRILWCNPVCPGGWRSYKK